jgi:hypothetical protein
MLALACALQGSNAMSRLEDVAEDLYSCVLPLEKSSEFRRRSLDARWRLEEALAELGAVISDDAPRRPRSMFGQMSDRQRDLTHDAFVAALALAQGLQHPQYDSLMRTGTFELAAMSCCNVLDALMPYVSWAHDSLRRVLLDDEPLEAALERIANAR